MDSTVLTRTENGVGWISLNRPQQRNALDIPTLGALHRLLQQYSEDGDIRAIVIAGSGRAFCAGADLAEWAAAEARGELETYGWTEAAHGLMVCLHDILKPTIAAVNGMALGAGLDLALCCDFRIAARSARFRAGYTTMGYAPDAGSSWHLPRLIGVEQAKRFLFLDEPLPAEHALALGLIGEVCDDESLQSVAGDFAARLAKGPTFAYAQTKQLIHGGASRDLGEQLSAETAAGLLCGRSEDGAEALRAATEKRPPRFLGR